MIIEVNTKILGENPGLNANQLLFLSIVMGKNQPKYQDVRVVLELIAQDEIQYLIEQGLVTSIERGDSVTYEPTDKLKQQVSPKKGYFDLFYDMYPSYVVRADGTKSYLRANVNKCRHYFDIKCGNSSAMAEHLIKCLEYEINKRMREGSLSYMMTMWNWITRNQWEAIEEEMNDKQTQVSSYGTELI